MSEYKIIIINIVLKMYTKPIIRSGVLLKYIWVFVILGFFCEINLSFFYILYYDIRVYIGSIKVLRSDGNSQFLSQHPKSESNNSPIKMGSKSYIIGKIRKPN